MGAKRGKENGKLPEGEKKDRNVNLRLKKTSGIKIMKKRLQQKGVHRPGTTRK